MVLFIHIHANVLHAIIFMYFQVRICHEVQFIGKSIKLNHMLGEQVIIIITGIIIINTSI